MIGERLGVPSAGIITEKFVTAARLMARALNAHGYDFVVVPHPISSATPEDLAASARQAAKECAQLLTQPPPDQ